MVPTCFACSRLNPTTFQVVEDDKWGEQPIIYVKLTASALVVIDTGCGGASRDPGVGLTSLRQFLETYPVEDNDGQPLNEDGKKEYVVICTHCHFDHIGAIAQFNDSSEASIWASGYDKSFLSKENLPTSSLCRFVGMDTPSYQISHWARDGEAVTHNGVDLGLEILHTPGHTPDELAVWDRNERVLFVGDTLYEWAPIIWPLEGDLVAYSDSLAKLKALVGGWNTSAPSHSGNSFRARVACGHVTSAADGEEILVNVDRFLFDVVSGLVKRQRTEIIRGEETAWYERSDGKFSFRAPVRLFEEFKKDSEAMDKLRRRHPN